MILSGFQHFSTPNSKLRLVADAKADMKDEKEAVVKKEQGTEKTGRKEKTRPKGKAKK